MKKLIATLLVIIMAVCTLFAFAGCDTIAPIGDSGSQGEEPDNQGQNPSVENPDTENPDTENPDTENPDTENPTTGTEWLKDDDYHWHTEADKALHTVENKVCTVCKKEGINYTVGLKYKLIESAGVQSEISYAVENESDGSYYSVIGCDLRLKDIVIPAMHNGLPVKEIGGFAFSALLTDIQIPKEVVSITSSEIWRTDLQNIFYEGTPQDWLAAGFMENNGLSDKNLYFYADSTSPSYGGDLWAYDADGSRKTFFKLVGSSYCTRLTVDCSDKYHMAYQTYPYLQFVINAVNGDNVDFELYAISRDGIITKLSANNGIYTYDQTLTVYEDGAFGNEKDIVLRFNMQVSVTVEDGNAFVSVSGTEAMNGSDYTRPEPEYEYTNSAYIFDLKMSD